MVGDTHLDLQIDSRCNLAHPTIAGPAAQLAFAKNLN